MKKIISFLLAFVFMFSCFSCVTVNATSEKLEIWFGGEDVDSKSSDKAVSWWKGNNNEYYLFVPSYWDATALKIFTNTAGDVKLGDTIVKNGETYNLGSSGTLTFGKQSYKYNVVSSSNVGTVFIKTESGSLDAIHEDKSYSESGNIYIYDENGECQTITKDKDGNKVEDNVLKSIKGRGNQTWEYPKRPYNIKLENKYKIFNMEKSKKWCLIANYDDSTLMRNSIAYGAAADANMPYTPEYAPTDLYINGEYKGSYILTSKIEADSKRIDVENLDDVNEEICTDKYGEDFDMDSLVKGGTYGRFAGLLENTYKYVEIPESEKSTTDGGYIIEMELANRYKNEICGFVTSHSQPITMKEPEYSSKAQIEFISDYYQRFEDAVYSDIGINSNGESYLELANLESLAKYYTISEWYSNMDSGLTSTYFYIDTTKDGVLYAGPVWDYDSALGNNTEKRYGCDYTNPEEFTVCFGRQYRNTIFGRLDVYEQATLFNKLAQKTEFAAACRKYWDSDIYAAALNWSNEKFDSYKDLIKNSAIMNHIRWNTYETYDTKAITEKYDSDVSALKNFVTKRTEFINENIGNIPKNVNTTNSFVEKIKKGFLKINNLFEKFIITFNLENK